MLILFIMHKKNQVRPSPVYLEYSILSAKHEHILDIFMGTTIHLLKVLR